MKSSIAMRTMLTSPTVALSVLVALALPSWQAQAQHGGGDSHGSEWHGHEQHDRGYHGPDFHGRDYNRFTPYERQTWNSGHWEHSWHDNRYAWWWTAGGGWYFYPAPVYPYPTSVPPAVVVQQPPPLPSGQAPAQFWYYCDNPPGYYPQVAACNGPWREVAAAPPN
jgi:hypothetical protein